MLYDILPPLFLLASFGGIAVILSRVVMRVQQQRLNQEIRAHATTNSSAPSEDLLRSRGSKISVVKNRLSLIPQGASSVMASIKGVRARRSERKEEKAALKEAQAQEEVQAQAAPQPQVVAQPVGGRFSRFKEGIQSVAQQGKDRLQSVRERHEEEVEEIEVEAVLPAKAKPVVRRVIANEEGSSDQSDSDEGTTRLGVQSMLRRKKSQSQDPLSRAATCLKQSQYDKAEDILLPYIIRHSKDTNAYMLLGRAAIGRGDWDEALEIFQQVRAIDENVPGLLGSLGHVALKAGRMTLAIETLQRARDAEPENITIREQLLTIAQHTDNKVLEKSVTEELSELRQEKTAAKAN